MKKNIYSLIAEMVQRKPAHFSHGWPGNCQRSQPSNDRSRDLCTLHEEVKKIKAWSYSSNFTNDLVILTVFVGLYGYMYNLIT